MKLIEIRPHRWGWKAFETPGVEPVFQKKDQAIDYAQGRACFRSGEIRVLRQCHPTARALTPENNSLLKNRTRGAASVATKRTVKHEKSRRNSPSQAPEPRAYSRLKRTPPRFGLSIKRTCERQSCSRGARCFWVQP